jgi:hypothetical protein
MREQVLYAIQARVAVALIVVFTLALPAQADIDSDDNDILDGQQYLVRSDDLVVADPAYVSGSPDMTDVGYFPLLTEDTEITTSQTVNPINVVKPDCTAGSTTDSDSTLENTPFPQQTQMMRMFNLPADVLVNLVPANDVTGTGCENDTAGKMVFYVRDPVAEITHKFPISESITNSWLHTAVADFNHDGFDDLFISSDKGIYIATANDTDNVSAGISIVSSHSSYGSGATAMNDPTIGDFNADGNLDVAWMGAPFFNNYKPSVKFVTICTGPIQNTVCASSDSFEILDSNATIAPVPEDDDGNTIGAIVTVGGKCTENDNNQIGSELRAPPMAVAAGQFDGSGGDDLLVVYLYEHDSNNNCHVMAEAYSFTQFSSDTGAGEDLAPNLGNRADNIAPHSHISNPSAIYAQAGTLDWSSSKDQVPVVISGGTSHSVMVISFGSDLTMKLQSNQFSTSHAKSFAGLAIGRFSSAPSATGSTTQCSTNSDCTDTCSNQVCSISGDSCSENSDCQGTCDSSNLCSYIASKDYDLQFASFLMAHASDHDSNVYVYTADTKSDFTPDQIQTFVVENFVQTATDRAVRAGSLLRAGDLESRSLRLGIPNVVKIAGNIQPDVIIGVPPMHADWLPFGQLDETQFCDPTPTDCPDTFSSSNPCNCTDLASNSTCSDGSQLRCLMNFSVLSGTFISQYDFSTSTTYQSSKTDTTSYSLGLSTDVSEKTKTLTPTGIQISQEVSFATTNTYNHSVSTTNSTYTEDQFDASTATGFYDHIWYTQRDYNAYYYPVIGQTICVDSCQPQGQCSDSGNACLNSSDCSSGAVCDGVSQCSGSGDTCSDDSACALGETCNSVTQCSITETSCSDDTDCSSDVSSCPDTDKQQLYVQYDGATSVTTGSAASTDNSGSGGDGINAGPIEWYQPVHEPGQVFSYPWDCEHLAARNDVSICDDSADDYTLLSMGAEYKTDDSLSTYSLQWSVGSGDSRTAAKSGQFSQKLTETVSASTPSIESEVEGLKLKESASISANESIGTSKTNSTSLGSSTGITVAFPGTFLTPAKFEYEVVGYIFGDAPKPGQLDKSSPDTASDIITNGVIRSAFTADPSIGGSWWVGSPYSQYIDVALNRPMHLVPLPSEDHYDPEQTNCLPTEPTDALRDDCVNYVLPDPSPTELWSSQFYWMRGFFITPADAIGQGPQLLQAEEGDVLALQARIYNYSLMDMDESSSIKVDFYAQQWDTSCNVPYGYYDHSQSCSSDGGATVDCTTSCNACCIANDPVDSIYLGQDVLPGLPGFHSLNMTDENGDSLPNWALATILFDTGSYDQCPSSGCGDTDLLFWVVAWPEGTDIDGNPALFSELPDHQLTGIPPQLTSIADICPIDNDCNNGLCRATGTSCTTNADCKTASDNTCSHDTCTVSGVACSTDADCGDCLCGLCMGQFGNNVAFYHATLAIKPAGTGAIQYTPATAPGSGSAALQDKVQLERISVIPATAGVGEKVVVRAGLRAIADEVDAQTVHFYAIPHDVLPLPVKLTAKHPRVKEAFARFTPFDQEILARIRSRGVHEAQVPFYPPAPGKYHLLVSGIIDGKELLLGDAELDVVEPGRVLICHKGKEIYVDKNALQGHLGHGDRKGPCQ